MAKHNIKKVVLAYSGGLDTSVILKWLQVTYGCEVVTFTADLGQGEELAPARIKAERMGIKEIFIEDLREDFVANYVFPMFRANALYEGVYLLGTSIARPLIAKRQIEIAEAVGADAVCHGSTGKGNDQVRFDVTFQTLDPSLKIIAPVREWKMTRDEEIKFAAKHGIPVEATKESPYSIDQNLWGRSCEAGVLEDPWDEPPADAIGTAQAIKFGQEHGRRQGAAIHRYRIAAREADFDIGRDIRRLFGRDRALIDIIGRFNRRIFQQFAFGGGMQKIGID